MGYAGVRQPLQSVIPIYIFSARNRQKLKNTKSENAVKIDNCRLPKNANTFLNAIAGRNIISTKKMMFGKIKSS